MRELTAPQIVTDAKGVQWEERPFVFAWPHKEWETGALLATKEEVARYEANIRQIVWDEYQPQIEADLRLMREERWAPMQEAGPSAIQLKTFRELDKSGCLMLVILGPARVKTLVRTQVEPVELRVMMRRKVCQLQD